MLAARVNGSLFILWGVSNLRLKFVWENILREIFLENNALFGVGNIMTPVASTAGCKFHSQLLWFGR